MTKQNLKLVCTITLIALLLTSCTSESSKGFSSLRDFQSQSLDWQSCYTENECAELIVPIDYENLELGTFEISLLRYPAGNQKKRIGSLVINPGGPGGSGVDYAYNAEYAFDPDVLDAFDIVGFDPRGVGRSEPIRCLTNNEIDDNYASDSKPDNPQELALAVKESKDFIAKCLRKNKYLTHFGSENTARDIDILRAALGEEKLNYVGKSYGTYIGTLYAKLFPDKVGRVVLDGAVDPNVSVLEQNISQAVGFENALEAFIEDCGKFPNCPVAKGVDEAKQEIISLLTSVAQNPLPQKSPYKSDARLATESILLLGTASALYEDVTGWPKLRKAIVEAKEGYGDTFIKLADLYSGRQSNGNYPNNELDSGAVIDCLDWGNSRTLAQMAKDAESFTAQSIVFGPYLAYSGLACKYLSKTNKKTATAESNKISKIDSTPVVIIGTTRDPATPYQWAVGLHKIFTSSVLITLDADGHTGHGRGSECIDEAVDKYLLTGKTPAKNLTCSL